VDAERCHGATDAVASDNYFVLLGEDVPDLPRAVERCCGEDFVNGVQEDLFFHCRRRVNSGVVRTRTIQVEEFALAAERDGWIPTLKERNLVTGRKEFQFFFLATRARRHAVQRVRRVAQ